MGLARAGPIRLSVGSSFLRVHIAETPWTSIEVQTAREGEEASGSAGQGSKRETKPLGGSSKDLRAAPRPNSMRATMTDSMLMIPTHPRWGEFIARLSRASICLGTMDHARAVLEQMPGTDVEGSLDAVQELGGHCDCEIVCAVAGMDEGPSPPWGR